MANIQPNAITAKYGADINTKIEQLATDLEYIKGDIGGWSLKSQYKVIESLTVDGLNNQSEKYKNKANEGLISGQQADIFASYIIKKRAALVYMCMLYVKKLKESEQRKVNDIDELIKIINNLNTLKDKVTSANANITWENVRSSTNTTTTTTTTVNTAETTALNLINGISKHVEKLLAKRKTEKDDSDNLLKDIIPFIAKQSELGEVPS